jgi:hypothetical protein
MKLEKLNKSYTVLTDEYKKIGSFHLDSDGGYYFWKTKNFPKKWSSHNLKKIADLLEEVNKEFEEENGYPELSRKNTEDQARVEYRELLNTGMFFEFYPALTGVWKDDKLEWFDEYDKLLGLRYGK